MGLDRNIDITPQQRKTILSLLETFLSNTTAWVYGSRVKWTSKPNSDLDMVVFSTSKQVAKVSLLQEAFDESDLPFRIDLHVWGDVPDQFRKNIKVDHVVLIESHKRILSCGVFPHKNLKLLCSKIGSGATPRGGSNVYLVSGECTLIRSQNILNNRFDKKGLVFIEQEHADKLSSVAVETGDVLLNITGDSVARCCQVDLSVLPARVNQHVAIIRTQPEHLNSMFLRYFLVSPVMQNHMLSLAGAGATRNALTKGMIESFDTPTPELSEQKAIAHILGSLDDKIELNRQMNATLEAMAQALFKSWFVDFDPVIDNALAAGNDIPEALQLKAAARQALINQRGNDKLLPDDIRQQFPSAFEFSETMGWIPEGWEVKELGEFGRVITGKTPAQKVENAFNTNGTPFITPTDIDESLFVNNTNRCLTKSGQDAIKNSFIHAGAICVTCIGSQMGKTTITPSDAYTNQQLNSIEVNKKYWRNILFLSLRSRREEIFLMGSSGSTMPIINKSTFERLLFLIPSKELLTYFDHFIEEILVRVLENDFQMNTLSKLRDTLLPKLLSGELRIPDVEKLVKEVL